VKSFTRSGDVLHGQWHLVELDVDSEMFLAKNFAECIWEVPDSHAREDSKYRWIDIHGAKEGNSKWIL
jgi:hypothetical protein